MDYLQFIFQAINNLLTQNLGFFDAMGHNPRGLVWREIGTLRRWRAAHV